MSFEYNNIVVAIDGSTASKKAFQKAIDIVKRNYAHLIIAHVVNFRAYAFAESFDSKISEQTEAYAEFLLDNYVAQAQAAGIQNISRCMEYGSPKVKIAQDIAKTYHADLIICGATGMNTIERFLIGSVSESITRYATCDVLVVR